MKAIVIAAGQGQRLRPYTADRPKCMVEVAGKPILHHQLDALHKSGIDDVVVIRGYKGRGISAPGCRFVDNREFTTNNILMSLFSAGPEFSGDVIVSYGDIVYHPAVLRELLKVHTPGVLVVDRAWQRTYEGRTDHPPTEAELTRVAGHGLVTEVGKQVTPDGAFGEFIGLARFSSALVARMWALYLRALSRGDKQPYGAAPTLRKAYLTDLINEAIDEGEVFAVLAIEGAWREIDTVQDLKRAASIAHWF